MRENFGIKGWYITAQLYRPAGEIEFDQLRHDLNLPMGVDALPCPENWRRAEGRLWAPHGNRLFTHNLVIDLAQQELLKAWSYISGSVRKIQTFSLGTGYTDPDRATDTDLTTLLVEKDIESWDDSLIAPDSTGKSIREAVCLWLSSEGNGIISEAGLKFDDDSLVTHAFWGPGKLTITNITQASEGVVTFSAAHGLSTGDQIRIENVVGMVEVNGNDYTITVVDADEVSLDGVNTLGYTAYDSLGNAWQNATKTTGEVLETRYGLTLTS